MGSEKERYREGRTLRDTDENPGADPGMERAVMRKLYGGIVVFLALANLMNGIDRLNLSVAALSMNSDLGFSATVFGIGVGAFFSTYVLFQVPANLALQRFGARRWLAFITTGWGICATAMGFVQSEFQFILTRLLLGAFEAGFFPAVIMLGARWIPENHRARFVGTVLAFGVVAAAIGPPIAAHLLGLDRWLGISGWRWLFVLEGLPTVLLGIVMLGMLPDGPESVRWLDARQKAWLQGSLRLEAKRQARPVDGVQTWRLSDLLQPRILFLGFVLFSSQSAAYTVVYWMPLIIKSMGLSNIQVGYAAALPSVVGCVAMLLLVQSSDRTGERRWHLFTAQLLGGIGLLTTSLLLDHLTLATIMLCTAASGIVSGAPVLWTLPPKMIAVRSYAVAIGFLTAVGNVGGIVSPFVMGRLFDLTHSYKWGLICAGMPMVIAALVIILGWHRLGLARHGQEPAGRPMPTEA
jgi:ACS family tartrate transporter-like MFS transporter